MRKHAALALFIIWFNTVSLFSDELKICDLTEKPFSLNPFENMDGKLCMRLMRLILDGWVNIDEKYILTPGIFGKWELQANGGWRFYLTKGLKFNDGETVTARDVKFSFDLARQKDSLIAGMYYSIKNINIISEDCIEFEMDKPDLIFPQKLLLRTFLVSKKNYENLGKDKYFKNPIGAGPYKLVSIDDDKIVLEKNKYYYKKTNGEDKIIFYFIKDDFERINALKTGKIDILTEVRATMTLDIVKNKELSIVKTPSGNRVILYFDLYKYPDLVFQNINLRKTLAYGIDYNRLILNALMGNGKRINSTIIPEEFGYNDKIKPYEFNIDKAKEYFDKFLKETGKSKPLKIKMATIDYLENVAKFIKAQTSLIGIDIEILSMSRADLYLDVWVKRSLYADCFLADPTYTYPDAMSRIEVEASRGYAAVYENAEILKLYGTSLIYETNADKRKEVLMEIQEIMANDFAAIPLFQKIDIYGTVKGIKGFMPNTSLILNLQDTDK